MDINEKRLFTSDDKYLFDLDVPVKENPDPGQYQYMVKLEHSYFIENVLTRSYYRYDSGIADNGEVCITTNCEPDAFKMVFERALMDKRRYETGAFSLTANEIRDQELADAILNMANENVYSVYNPPMDPMD